MLLFVVLHCFYYIEFRSCNSRVSIETRFRPSVPFTGVNGVGLPVEARRGGGRSLAGPRHCSRPMPGPHRLIDITGGGTPKTARGGGYRGSATGEAQWPIGRREGNRRASPPRADVAGQSVSVVGGWARTLADSSWVSGTMAHLSNHRRGARWGDTIADRPPDAGYGRPQACCRTRPDDQPTSQ